MGLDDFFFLNGPLPADLHCAFVGLQAGYLPPSSASLLPQGPPVLQFIHPLPLFLANQP
jgi:hypothetical protein